MLLSDNKKGNRNPIAFCLGFTYLKHSYAFSDVIVSFYSTFSGTKNRRHLTGSSV